MDGAQSNDQNSLWRGREKSVGPDESTTSADGRLAGESYQRRAAAAAFLFCWPTCAAHCAEPVKGSLRRATSARS